MSMFTMRMHPAFEALSALADLGELDGARTRAGRHVAKCAECRAVLAEIRALGEGARAIELAGAPEDLWARIAAGQDDNVTPLHGAADASASGHQRDFTRAPVIERNAGDTERRSGRYRARVWVVSAAAAALLAVLVLWPSGHSLSATGTSRFILSPGRPVPGGTLNVRYTPAAYLRGAPRLVLIGWFAASPGTPKAAWHGPAFDVDSLASLVLTADGSYRAELALPADFRSVHLAVVDSLGERMDRDGATMWIAIGGNIDRSPSLASLLSAVESPRSIGSFNNRLVTGPAVSVADSIQRYFHGHPAGWALYKGYGVRKGVFDVLRFFESAERKYASLDETLWRRGGLDALQMHAMVDFALRISEPTEAAKWATRLLREHPTSPHALADVGSAIHQMEINSAPAVADSVRSWLPLLTAPRVAAGPAAKHYTIISRLVHRYGDSAQKAAWPLREPFHEFSVPGAYSKGPTTDEQRQLRERLAESCDRPAGRFSATTGTRSVEEWCRLSRLHSYVRLARGELRLGNYREVTRLVELALATAPASACGAVFAYRTRAEARIALGDTTGAARDLAVVAGSYRRFAGIADSLRQLTERRGGNVATFDTIADSARTAFASCETRRRSANEARSGSFTQGLY